MGVFALYVVGTSSLRMRNPLTEGPANVGVFFALSLVTIPRPAWLTKTRDTLLRRKASVLA